MVDAYEIGLALAAPGSLEDAIRQSINDFGALDDAAMAAGAGYSVPAEPSGLGSRQGVATSVRIRPGLEGENKAAHVRENDEEPAGGKQEAAPGPVAGGPVSSGLQGVWRKAVSAFGARSGLNQPEMGQGVAPLSIMGVADEARSEPGVSLLDKTAELGRRGGVGAGGIAPVGEVRGSVAGFAVGSEGLGEGRGPDVLATAATGQEGFLGSFAPTVSDAGGGGAQGSRDDVGTDVGGRESVLSMTSDLMRASRAPVGHSGQRTRGSTRMSGLGSSTPGGRGGQGADGGSEDGGAGPRGLFSSAGVSPQSEGGGGRGRETTPIVLDGRVVGQWLSEEMARDAGRPGAGATFFDPRQSPAWTPSGAI